MATLVFIMISTPVPSAVVFYIRRWWWGDVLPLTIAFMERITLKVKIIVGSITHNWV